MSFNPTLLVRKRTPSSKEFVLQAISGHFSKCGSQVCLQLNIRNYVPKFEYCMKILKILDARPGFIIDR